MKVTTLYEVLQQSVEKFSTRTAFSLWRGAGVTYSEVGERVEQIKAIESFIKELEAEAETYKDEIKAVMNSEAVETLEAGDYIIRWTSTLTSRFNTKKFKEDMGEAVYNAYLKQVASKRFSIA